MKEKIEKGCKAIETTLDKKTGSWRSVRPVITDKCKGCGVCAQTCPEKCIELVQAGQMKKARIDYNYCKGCLICMIQCPFKCIRKEDEKK